MDTPAVLTPHQDKYKPNAWEQYTIEELGHWVHNFVKRAGHRTEKAKAEKDLEDAQNYLAMMQEHINEAKRKVPVA